MTCSDMGGMCDAEISGETPEEMIESGKKHVHDAAEGGDTAHSELVEKMKAITPEEYKMWEDGFRAKYDTAPEV